MKKLREKDFIFEQSIIEDCECELYVFKIIDDSRDYLESKYPQAFDSKITGVVYSAFDDQITLRIDSSLGTTYSDRFRDKELKEFLESIIKNTRNTYPANQPPLTIQEMLYMDGLPCWCEDYKTWGLIFINPDDKQYRDTPFFLYTRRGVKYLLDIPGRDLVIYKKPFNE